MEEMRRKDRRLGEEETQAILQKCQYGILSTADKDGKPYGVPVSYACEKGVLYFHCARGAGKKYRNIMERAQVCFTAVGDTQVQPSEFGTKYESAIVFGTARKVEDAGEKQKALEALIRKYSSEFWTEGLAYISRAGKATDVFAIDVEQASGKAKR